MTVYFITEKWTGTGELGPIKIGHTTNLRERRIQLNQLYQREFLFLGVISGGRKKEAALHDKFSRYRYSRSEWFKPSDVLLSWIRNNARLPTQPELRKARTQMVVVIDEFFYDEVKEKVFTGNYKSVTRVVTKLLDQWLKGHIELPQEKYRPLVRQEVIEDMVSVGRKLR